ncbi:MAG: cell division protein SepF [Eubacteriales bacterium]|nr:cell division protein SepF [Eubacteriales bacterium]MDD4323909.1 cell division protein SepF [Eubacteriales bacterium]MDD4541025.1 cell division protein SepF [Eubacteriales bacterium]
MSFLNKLLGNPPEEDFDDYYEEDYEVANRPYDEPVVERQPKRAARDNRVVDIRDARNDSQHTVMLVEAVDIDSAWPVCDHVKSGYTVICNTERMSQDIRVRFQDIVSGSAYAIGGILQMVSQYIFVFAPRSTRIDFDDGHFSAEAFRGAAASGRAKTYNGPAMR